MDSNSFEWFKLWNCRIRHWSTMFSGTSYYHQPQGLGRKFVASRLSGYFNDLTGKAAWQGACDEAGLPIVSLTNGRTVRFPILLCQKALGHWDLWLMHGRTEEQEAFLKIARWLCATQDSAGGWNTWGLLGKPDIHRYSAMTQGQALSVMARAHAVTHEEAFNRACRRALEMMKKPVQDGGVCHYEGGDVILEEFPGKERDTVLNGWLFAIFGIYDYLLEFKDQSGEEFFRATFSSVLRHLERFDAGFWSYYSSGTKRLASPFYHDLHISQLEALSRITDQNPVRTVQTMWMRYSKDRTCKARAIVVKGLQKLRERPEVAILN